MSGGYFDYEQYKIEQIADEIESELQCGIHPPYCKSTTDEFKKAVRLLREAYVYAQRIDWLLSSDDGEDTFHRRLKADLAELNQQT